MKSESLFNLPVLGENDLPDVNLTADSINESCRGYGRGLSADDVVIKDKRKPRKKRILKKIVRFFVAVVRPILIFVPNFINAMANYKRAIALAC